MMAHLQEYVPQPEVARGDDGTLAKPRSFGHFVKWRDEIEDIITRFAAEAEQDGAYARRLAAEAILMAGFGK